MQVCLFIANSTFGWSIPPEKLPFIIISPNFPLISCVAYKLHKPQPVMQKATSSDVILDACVWQCSFCKQVAHTVPLLALISGVRKGVRVVFSVMKHQTVHSITTVSDIYVCKAVYLPANQSTLSEVWIHFVMKKNSVDLRNGEVYHIEVES